MASFDFNPIADYVVLRFTCPECNALNETEALSVPTPDFSAETHHDSINYENYEHECPNCGHLFDITINNGIYGGDGDISDVNNEDGVSVEEGFPEEDYEEYKSLFFDEHVKETIDVLDKIDTLDEVSRKLLYRTLYANVISSMEAYLSDRLIQKVLSSETVKRQFIENFKDFKEHKISMSDIFKQMESLDSFIRKTLREIIYHNLPRVKNIYKTTFGIDFGDVSELMKSIAIRHDIVHRNGKDKNGVLCEISKDDVLTLAEQVSFFIGNIESGFSALTEEEIPMPAELPFD
ncbi:MAG: hypothetical protein ACLRPS_00360 [Paraprevotella clara]|uniref:RiboL-PSP-HEPN domain-containing protein n=1 Tax=Paraprevotella clara TaxID=454154 RepID=A0A6N3C7Q0_9BACT